MRSSVPNEEASGVASFAWHMHMSSRSEVQARHTTDFVRNFRPRVERNVQHSIYTRALSDPRPGSIAWAKPENANGSVSLSMTLSKTISQSSMFSTGTLKCSHPAWERPPTHTPMGERRNLFEVRRVGDNHFTFSQGSSTLDPGPGYIRDRDTVEKAAERLQVLYPDALPMLIGMGDATLPGLPPSRPVRNVFAAKGTVLQDTFPIGAQCQRTDFNKYYRPKQFFATGLMGPR